MMAAGLVEDEAVTLGVRYLTRTHAEDGFWKEERFTATGFPAPLHGGTMNLTVGFLARTVSGTWLQS
jgi:hypothetical protein